MEETCSFPPGILTLLGGLELRKGGVCVCKLFGVA